MHLIIPQTKFKESIPKDIEWVAIIAEAYAS